MSNATRMRSHAGTFLVCAAALLLLAGIYQRVANPSLTFHLETAAPADAAGHDHPALAPEDAEMLGRAMARLQKTPEDLDLLLSIAAIFSRNKDWINAVGFLDRAVHLAPSDMRPHYYLGIAFASQGDYAKAEKAFESALAASPGNPETMFSLGVLSRYHLGKPQKAAEMFRAVAASPAAREDLRKNAREQLTTGP